MQEYLQSCLLSEITTLTRIEKQLFKLIYGRHVSTVQMDRIRRELNVSRWVQLKNIGLIFIFDNISLQGIIFKFSYVIVQNILKHK